MNPPLTFLMIKRSMEYKNYPRQRQWIPLHECSLNFLEALLLAEDPGFFRHRGVYWKAFWRRAYKTLRTPSQRPKIGGSTISQQTAKNVFLFPGRSVFRKALEAYYTMLIELIWGKKRILEVYINTIEMGKNIYGIEAVSQVFFRKNAQELTLEEAIAIVVTLPSPTVFHPIHANSYQRKKEAMLERKCRIHHSKFHKELVKNLFY